MNVQGRMLNLKGKSLAELSVQSLFARDDYLDHPVNIKISFFQVRHKWVKNGTISHKRRNKKRKNNTGRKMKM